MKFSIPFLGLFASLLILSSAQADLLIKFDEGAPKDRFTFANTGACKLENAVIRLDLSGSKAGLIFDTTSKGAGVEVFQPLEFVSGANSLSSKPSVKDGDTSIDLRIAALGPQQAIAFTIDVDDTMGGREITVSNSEILGATVELQQAGVSTSTSFETGSRTELRLPKC